MAGDVGTVFLDTTRDFRAYAYRVERVADIEWRPQLTATEQGERDRVVAGYGTQVRPPSAERSADGGWRVVVWMVQGHDLVRHELDVATARPLTDRPTTLVADLPVPISR